MAFFNEFPHTRTYDNDLGWIIKTIKALEENLQNFIKLNTVKYADPIQWDISNQYESNTVVIDALTGVAYISTHPVPSGVNINNTDYWTPVFTLDLVNLNKNITLRNDGDNHNATFESVVGDWIIVGGQLYKVIKNIGLYTAYVVDYNIQIYSVELFIRDYLNQVLTIIGDLDDLTTSDKTSVVNAINSALSDIDDKIGDLKDLTTSDKTSVVKAINSVLSDLSNDISNIDHKIGDLQDLTTSDKTSVVNAINSVATQTVSDLLVDGGLKLYGTIDLLIDENGYLGQGFAIHDGFTYIGFGGVSGSSNSKLLKYKGDTFVNSIEGPFHHMNSLTVDKDNNILYSADTLDYNPLVRYSSISVFNLNTFTFMRTINTDISTDIASNALFFVKGKLYNIGLDNKVYEINVNTGESSVKCTLDYDGYTTYQSADADEHYIYVCTSAPGGIITYDWNGNRINSLNIGEKIDQCYTLGEIEDISIDGDHLYISNRLYGAYSIIKCNRNHSPSMIGNGLMGVLESTIYADGIENTVDRIRSYHFKTAQEALLFIHSCPAGNYTIEASGNVGDITFNDTNHNVNFSYTGSYAGNIVIRSGNFNFYGDIDGTIDAVRFRINCQYGTAFNLSIWGSITGNPQTANNPFILHEVGTGIINIQNLNHLSSGKMIDIGSGCELITGQKIFTINNRSIGKVIGDFNSQCVGVLSGYSKYTINLGSSFTYTTSINLETYNIQLVPGAKITFSFSNYASFSCIYIENNQTACGTIRYYKTDVGNIPVYIVAELTATKITLYAYDLAADGTYNGLNTSIDIRKIFIS